MRKRFTTVERLERTAITALHGGYGRIASWSSPNDRYQGQLHRVIHLDVQMDCEQPYEYALHARHSATHGKAVKPITIVVHSRCRKCGNCKERRRMFWAARAITEFQKSHTTFFGTLTLDPQRDVEIDALARIELSERGVDFDRDLTAAERFRVRTRYGGMEITRWLKRLREGDRFREKPQFRYLLIAEAHNGAKTSEAKRGRPHWHVLLHECTGDFRLVLPGEWMRKSNGQPATDQHGNPLVGDHAFLKQQWTYGLSRWALCRTPQAASYLCKYLTKEEARVRLRASFRYGVEDDDKTEAKSATQAEGRKGKELDSLQQRDNPIICSAV